MASKELLKESGTAIRALPEVALSGRLQIQNILCPVDFTEFSYRAFLYAAGIARHFQSRLFLQHTVHLSPALFLEGAPPTATHETLQTAIQQADAEIRRLVAGVRPDLLPEISMLLSEGDIRDRILQCIEEHRIDLLVMGTHSRKGFHRLLLGSVAERIVHEAVCPVLVVSRPQKEFVRLEDSEPLHLKTLLLATDFSRHSDRALAYALRWASECSAKVILFHAVETSPRATKERIELFPEYNSYFEKQVAEAWEKIHMQAPEAAHKNCELAYEVRQGNAKEQVLQVAEENGADLIAMGARGLSRSAVAWGSTISGVVRDGRFPVLGVCHRLG